MACENKCGMSVAYGLLSYVMAYLKHYYPVEFMTALLISEMGDYEQTSKYIDACNKMGIKVSPPDINKSERIYTVAEIDGEKSIVFGLESIKGVGESAVNEILDIRNNGRIVTVEEETRFIRAGEFDSLADFHDRTVVDKSTTVSLIKAGAFGADKVNMLKEYGKLIYVPTKYKEVAKCPAKKVLVNYGVITEEEADGIKRMSKEDKEVYLVKYNKAKKEEYLRKEEVRFEKHMGEFDKYIGTPEMYEYETLSIFLNGNPFDLYRPLIKPFMNYDDGEEKILFVGTIVNIQRKKQKNGSTYAYIEVLTPAEGIFEGMVFNKQYMEYQDLIFKGSNIVCLVKKTGTQFIASKIRSLDSWRDIAEKKLQERFSLDNY